MDSLHPPCTPLKKSYDSCFNLWFEEYLQLAAPQQSLATSASASSQDVGKGDADRQSKIRIKAEEYEKRCGGTWRAYRHCLEVGCISSILVNDVLRIDASCRRARLTVYISINMPLITDRTTGKRLGNAYQRSERTVPSEVTERSRHARLRELDRLRFSDKKRFSTR